MNSNVNIHCSICTSDEHVDQNCPYNQSDEDILDEMVGGGCKDDLNGNGTEQDPYGSFETIKRGRNCVKINEYFYTCDEGKKKIYKKDRSNRSSKVKEEESEECAGSVDSNTTTNSTEVESVQEQEEEPEEPEEPEGPEEQEEQHKFLELLKEDWKGIAYDPSKKYGFLRYNKNYYPIIINEGKLGEKRGDPDTPANFQLINRSIKYKFDNYSINSTVMEKDSIIYVCNNGDCNLGLVERGKLKDFINNIIKFISKVNKYNKSEELTKDNIQSLLDNISIIPKLKLLQDLDIYDNLPENFKKKLEKIQNELPASNIIKMITNEYKNLTENTKIKIEVSSTPPLPDNKMKYKFADAPIEYNCNKDLNICFELSQKIFCSDGFIDDVENKCFNIDKESVYNFKTYEFYKLWKKKRNEIINGESDIIKSYYLKGLSKIGISSSGSVTNDMVYGTIAIVTFMFTTKHYSSKKAGVIQAVGSSHLHSPTKGLLGNLTRFTKGYNYREYINSSKPADRKRINYFNTHLIQFDEKSPLVSYTEIKR